MDTLSVVAAIAVGLAFVIAGGSKLAARESWSTQAVGLGAPRWSIGLLPWVELIIGAGLVAQLERRLFAVAAAGLLLAFTALILMRLREGKRPPCACFGALSAKPIGAGHVARNVAMIAAALLAAA